ncbi:MAG: NAD(P)H-dependent oxidoreductase [Anaerolineales bacterium]|nr:NAD(P)H-dependent oxidoreductase [Anaerolineales bacterium]
MSEILAFAGSSRKDSYNKKLVSISAAGARSAGAEVRVIDLADFPMPIFNQDLEAVDGMPGKAGEFKKLMVVHDGFLIASPEYNSSFSPLLKNAIDWASRAESEDEPSLAAFRGKKAVLMAASPGGYGGSRGLVPLRMLLGNLGVFLLPDQVAVSHAFQAFGNNGSLVDEKQQKAVCNLGARRAEFSTPGG